MRYWEYAEFEIKNPADLNQYGAEGWELVHLACAYDRGIWVYHNVAIFKRELAKCPACGSLFREGHTCATGGDQTVPSC